MLQDGNVELKTKNYTLTNLSVFEGLPIEELIVGLAQTNSTFTDLSPLQKMPLRKFTAQDTKFTNLTALTGMNLELLQIDSANVLDLSPLRSMKLRRIAA